MNAIPNLESRFLNYGLRATSADSRSKKEHGSQKSFNSGPLGSLTQILDDLAAYQVPHGSFSHFYVVSVLSSLFWGLQILSGGRLLHSICRAQIHGGNGAMTMEQITLIWSLMLIQGMRRLAESYFVTKHSASRMWFVHWYLGIAFYLAMGIAIWIEGAGACRNLDIQVLSTKHL